MPVSASDSRQYRSDGRTVERDFDVPAPDLTDWSGPTFDRAAVVIDDDGVTRERDFQPHQHDGYDQPGADW